MNTKKEKIYTYDWTWMALVCIWFGLEGYWYGVVLEGKLPLSVSLGMVFLSVGLCLTFLLAFLNSRREIRE
jgi:hypothetical protein